MMEILNTIVTTILLYVFYGFLAAIALTCVGILFALSLYIIPWILFGLIILLIFEGQGLWALIPIFLLPVWYKIATVGLPPPEKNHYTRM